jgi:hypothetical protein
MFSFDIMINSYLTYANAQLWFISYFNIPRDFVTIDKEEKKTVLDCQ